MRIKRFNEELVEKMSNETIEDFIKKLTEFQDIISGKNNTIPGLLESMEKYKADDKISDLIGSLHIINKSLDTAIDKLDSSINSLNDYKDDNSLDQQNNNN